MTADISPAAGPSLPTQEDGWTRVCRYSNIGPVCTHCGKPAPTPTQPTDELADECSACHGDECAALRCLKAQRPCGHHCNCVMIHDHCHFCGMEWGESGIATGCDRHIFADTGECVVCGAHRDLVRAAHLRATKPAVEEARRG